MGYGYRLKCSCGKEYQIYFEVGMRFTDMYRAVLRKMKKDDYGEVWGKWSREKEGIVVDINKGVYICPECGNWSNSPALDIYRLKPCADTQKTPQVHQRKTPLYIPMTPSEDPGFRLAVKYQHVCERCGAVMSEVEPSPLKNKYGCRNEITPPPLKCPVCGRLLEVTDHMYWD